MAMLARTLQAPPRRVSRPGLTLLEVLVSLAIFLMALVALSRLIGMGSDFARDAQQQTECLRLAQSKLNELMAGVTTLESTSGAFDANADEAMYQYTIDVADNEEGLNGLHNVTVTVFRERPDGSKMSVSLSHMLYDPALRGTTVPPPSTSSSSGGGQ